MTTPVLVVNAGSTSLKLSAVAADESSEPVESLSALPDGVVAVAHRVVHGGERFREPVLLEADVERALAKLTPLAPLQNRRALEAIDAARRALPEVPHVAVFDTMFHLTLREEASTYAVPARWREQWGIRRYGFHGLSVQWAAERVPVSRLVVSHLGGGCSVTAVLDGQSVDTTMGFTPLEGVAMATRAGSVDPGALIYLLREKELTVEALEDELEQRSGLLGLSGFTSRVEELEGSPDPAARVALDVYTYRIAAAVAAMAVPLGGLDALVFTAGVGEHSHAVRERVCGLLSFLGIELDVARNRAAVPDVDVGANASEVRVVVLRAREDVIAARAARSLLA